MAQEKKAPPHITPKNREIENHTTRWDHFRADFSLYFIVTIILGIIVGIFLHGFGKLPIEVVTITVGLGAFIGIIVGGIESSIKKSLLKVIIEIWKNAHQIVMILAGTFTVLIFTLAVLLGPTLLGNVQSNLPNPYPPNSGSLVVNDPLHENSQGFKWDDFGNGYGTCSFRGDNYHISSIQTGSYHRCGVQAMSSFSDFTYEVKMTILNGDCGALIFRGDFVHYRYYYFHICQDGSYQLSIYTQQAPATKLFSSGHNPNINRGLGQANIIAVVAIHDMITIYTNHQSIYSVHDNTYTQGQIGLAAENLDAPPTDIAFSDLKVWKL